MDEQVFLLGVIKSAEGKPKYSRIAKILKAIVSIPHSKAECERQFSIVKKK